MTWLDIVAILLVVLIAWAESVRGFGRAIFDFVGLLIALKMATYLAEPLADVAPLLSSEAAAEGFWMAAAFLVLVALIVIATKYVYETTLLSLDVLDPVVGAVLGVASGLVVAHMLLRVLLTAYAGTEFADVVAGSFVGQEIIALRTYHRTVTALQSIGHW